MYYTKIIENGSPEPILIFLKLIIKIIKQCLFLKYNLIALDSNVRQYFWSMTNKWK